jgi:hypothetical protein
MFSAKALRMMLKIEGDTSMNRITFISVAAAFLASLLTFAPYVSGHTDEKASQNYEGKIPAGYRDWKLISVALPLRSPGNTVESSGGPSY